MDALDLLVEQHREVDQLLARLEELGTAGGEELEEARSLLVERLTVHSYLEERGFYPTVRAAVPDLADEIARDLREHRRAEQLLTELDDLAFDDPGVPRIVEALVRDVRDHVEDEEHGLFPRLRDELDPQVLEDLGTVLAALAEVAPTHPQDKGTDVEDPVDAAVDGEAAAAMQRIREAVSA